MGDIEFKVLAEKEIGIERQILDLLKSNNTSLFERVQREIEGITAESRLKVTFAGLYNAGKSTIISALTGDTDIQISSDVQTDKTAEYEWGKVLLYDTPGIKAGIQEQHDEEAMVAIENADIIVFCITASLMDTSFLEDFVRLSYDHQYKNKIILLVNKMSMEDGEYEVLVEHYMKSLKENMQSYGGEIEDFPICFIDAADYKEGIQSNDNELVSFSQFDSFINVLNDEIKRRGIYAKIVSRYTILSDGICQAVESTGTELDKNMMRVLDRLSRAIQRKQKEAQNRILLFNDELKKEIRDIGEREIISKIGEEVITEAMKNDTDHHIQEATENSIIKIEQYLNEVNEELNEEIANYLTDDSGMIVLEEISNPDYNVDSKTIKSYTSLLQKYQEITKRISAEGAKLARMAIAKNGGNVAKLGDVAGSKLHLMVKSIGHFFGKSFKPWGAVKIAAKIGKVAKYAGPVMEGVNALLVVADKAYTEIQRAEINKMKKEGMNTFSDIALSIIKEIDNKYKEIEETLFKNRLSEVKETKIAMLDEADSNQLFIKQLQEEQKNINSALEEIKQIEMTSSEMNY